MFDNGFIMALTVRAYMNSRPNFLKCFSRSGKRFISISHFIQRYTVK